MYSYRIDSRQARSILVFTLSLIVLAIITALLAVTYVSYYGIMGALSAGFSVGSGVMFSFLAIYMGDTSRKGKFILSSLLLVTIVSFIIVDLPSSQYRAGTNYHFNVVGLIATIPFVISFIASLHMILMYVMKRRKVGFSIKSIHS